MVDIQPPQWFADWAQSIPLKGLTPATAEQLFGTWVAALGVAVLMIDTLAVLLCLKIPFPGELLQRPLKYIGAGGVAILLVGLVKIVYPEVEWLLLFAGGIAATALLVVLIRHSR